MNTTIENEISELKNTLHARIQHRVFEMSEKYIEKSEQNNNSDNKDE